MKKVLILLLLPLFLFAVDCNRCGDNGGYWKDTGEAPRDLQYCDTYTPISGLGVPVEHIDCPSKLTFDDICTYDGGVDHYKVIEKVVEDINIPYQTENHGEYFDFAAEHYIRRQSKNLECVTCDEPDVALVVPSGYIMSSIDIMDSTQSGVCPLQDPFKVQDCFDAGGMVVSGLKDCCAVSACVVPEAPLCDPIDPDYNEYPVNLLSASYWTSCDSAPFPGNAPYTGSETQYGNICNAAGGYILTGQFTDPDNPSTCCDVYVCFHGVLPEDQNDTSPPPVPDNNDSGGNGGGNPDNGNPDNNISCPLGEYYSEQVGHCVSFFPDNNNSENGSAGSAGNSGGSGSGSFGGQIGDDNVSLDLNMSIVDKNSSLIFEYDYDATQDKFKNHNAFVTQTVKVFFSHMLSNVFNLNTIKLPPLAGDCGCEELVLNYNTPIGVVSGHTSKCSSEDSFLAKFSAVMMFLAYLFGIRSFIKGL